MFYTLQMPSGAWSSNRTFNPQTATTTLLYSRCVVKYQWLFDKHKYKADFAKGSIQ